MKYQLHKTGCTVSALVIIKFNVPIPGCLHGIESVRRHLIALLVSLVLSSIAYAFIASGFYALGTWRHEQCSIENPL